MDKRSNMSDFEFINVVRNGKILEITINRPKAYNALFGPAHRELDKAFNMLESDPDLWVGIITGAGDKAFCSGNDLKATNEGGDISSPDSGFGGLCSRLDRETPVIAAVNGVAMGGGMEIALASDLIVASANARFALPEVKVGLFAGAGGVQRLTRQIGRKKAMELILTGQIFSAQQALEYGVINQVSEAEGSGVMEDARKLAEQIIQASPTAIRASKRVMNDLDKIEGLEGSMDAANGHFETLLGTNDAKEGVAAFVEKRAPKWTNT